LTRGLTKRVVFTFPSNRRGVPLLPSISTLSSSKLVRACLVTFCPTHALHHVGPNACPAIRYPASHFLVPYPLFPPSFLIILWRRKSRSVITSYVPPYPPATTSGRLLFRPPTIKKIPCPPFGRGHCEANVLPPGRPFFVHGFWREFLKVEFSPPPKTVVQVTRLRIRSGSSILGRQVLRRSILGPSGVSIF